MLAHGADIAVRQNIALVNVVANLANKAFFRLLGRLGLGFYVIKIVLIS